ncbi:2,3-bisphosphoglycerate-dependent phosphoglycerate mutase [Chryseobacterium oranimense G311]|uniref:histidine phosphatase family protein n=1 Tax=Chryseobacterium oranimense TaxID=421058 RepID=UPI00053393F1|nr:histidine phosphatase family protein [Chryseobacterium oranimense]CEJ72046.1 2,3-bisphosphoglycerate-dependent phosphoglycerate mutase [Chryseobacterium oranimense G311]
MFKKKNIITVQHPESVHHKNGMIGSWTDWKLTEAGIQQAENIAANLKSEFKDTSFSLYASPLNRTRETAEIIGKKINIIPQFTTALKERNLGKAVGQSVLWLKENIEKEELTVYDKCFSDAESRFDVWQRMWTFYESIVDSAEENIIIVSHGDSLSVFNVMWLGLNVEMLNTIDLYGVSGGVSFLQQTIHGKRIIKKMSDTSYQMINAQKLL